MKRCVLSIVVVSAIAIAGCGDDAAECLTTPDCPTGERCVMGGCQPGDSGTPDSGSDAARDGGDADVGPTDSGGGDARPDAGCPGGACDEIIALDGSGVGQPCALRRDGELLCIDTAPDEPPVFTSIGTFLGTEQITRGSTLTCLLNEAHTVQCFRSGMAPFDVADLIDASFIDTWTDHTCVVRGGAGTVSCWGDNAFGQIEGGGASTYPTLHDVPGITGVAQVATSRQATCALLRDGTVSCWGDNFGGPATPIPGIADGVAITGGHFHFCVTTSAGAVECFGGERAGTEATVPAGITDAAEAIAFHSETCYRSTTGAVSCWGETGMPGQTTAQPLEPVVGLDDAVLLANHCAVRATGLVTCWRGRTELVDATGL